MPETHNIFVIGINKESEIVFFKSYDYKTQRAEALADYKFASENYSGYYLTTFKAWKLINDEGAFTINIKNPYNQ